MSVSRACAKWALAVFMAMFACMLCCALPAFADEATGGQGQGQGQGDLVATTPAAGDSGEAGTSTDTTAGEQAGKPFTGKGVFYISAPSNKKLVFGMKKNKRVNGIPIVLAARKNTNLLKFKLVPAGKEGLYYIENVATHRELSVDIDEISGSSKNAAMITAESDAYQRWQVTQNDDGTVSFTNPKTGLRLSLANARAAKNVKLVVAQPQESSMQKFTLTKTAKKKNEIVQIGVPCLMQKPQLPTGCESVALTNALNYWGFHLGKTVIADHWMPYGGNGVYNFIGNPHNASGWIICAPGICNTANKFLSHKGSDVTAEVVKGQSLKSLREYLDEGSPVVVWTTIGMGSPGGVSSVKSGYPLRTYNNHAVVLTGYNPKTGAYQVSDSLAGRVWRNGSRFTWIYNAMGKQAVVLYN